MTDKLTSMIIVGGTRFNGGCKVETAQGAIDRLWHRQEAMHALLLRVSGFRNRLPEALAEDIEEFFRDNVPPLPQR